MESSTLKKKAKDAFDKTTDYLSEAKDSVTENVGDFVDDAKDTMSSRESPVFGYRAPCPGGRRAAP